MLRRRIFRSDDVLGLEACSGQWRRLKRERLRGPALLAGHIAFRHWTLLNAIDRVPGDSIENEHETGFCDEYERRRLSSVANDVDEAGRRRQVHVPQVMMHGLEIPLHLAGRRVERDERVREKVRAPSVAAVEIVVWAAERDVDDAAVF